jgi:hypothetical protein
MRTVAFFEVAEHLDLAGLIWRPEIGDEVSRRDDPRKISILVDPKGLAPAELRATYLWLPSVEQMVSQIESRQAILFHTGLELANTSFCYKTVISWQSEFFENYALSLRNSMGLALRDLLLAREKKLVN